MDDMLWRHAGQVSRVTFPQFFGRLEITTIIEVVFPRQIECAGDVPGDFVERFNGTVEALFGARIEQAVIAFDANALDFIGIDAKFSVEARGKCRCLNCGRGCRDRQTFALPTRKSAV